MDDLELCSIDSADWPRDGHVIMNQTVGQLMLALLAAIERTRAHGQEAHAIARLPLVENELRQLSFWIEILQRRLRDTDPKHRAQYTASERALIMEYATQKGWRAKDIAKNALVDESTARQWRHDWIEKPQSSLFTERTAWNSYDDALRSTCSGRPFG